MILNNHTFFSRCDAPTTAHLPSRFRFCILIPFSLSSFNTPLSLSYFRSHPGHPRGGTLFRPQLAAASQLRGLVRTTIWWVCGALAMSLTSRVFGLFTTTETSSDSPASLASSSPPSSPQNAGHATSTVSPVNEGIGSLGAQHGASQSSAMVEEEEEPRPPYLHVCLVICPLLMIWGIVLRWVGLTIGLL